MPRAEPGIHGLKSWGRNWSRKVRETRSLSNHRRSEPAAHPCRGPGGQAGDDHGGSPCFKGGVEPGRAPAGVGRELLRLCVDERVRSLFHRRAVQFKQRLTALLDTMPAVAEDGRVRRQLPKPAIPRTATIASLSGG